MCKVKNIPYYYGKIDFKNFSELAHEIDFIKLKISFIYPPHWRV